MTELCADLIERALTTRRLGRPALFFRSVGSTNDVAREQAAAGAGDGLLVAADEQTAGRGRQGRHWWAPSGTCLLMSLLLRPPLPVARASQLTMCLGLGAVEAIAQVAGLRAMLKWPNDLLLDGRKLGGMLTELQTEDDRLDFAVLGLGINVNLTFDEGQRIGGQGDSPRVHPPPDLASTAVSLQMALGRPVDRVALLAAILAAAEVWYDRVYLGETPHTAWAARLDTLGRRVMVTLPDSELLGEAAGVTPEGGLVLRDDAGREHVVWSGDVTALRPA